MSIGSSATGTMMITVTLLMMMTMLSVSSQQGVLLDEKKLAPVGIFFQDPFKIKITGPQTTKLLVIKLMPNLGTAQTCAEPAIEEYKGLIANVINPIQQVLTRTTNAVPVENTTTRLFGAVVGSVALGVATAAQITAGIALHNSIENAKAIDQMKSAILATNEAVQNLVNAQKQTVTVINTMQNQINNEIIPAINTVACSVTRNRMSIILTQFFSYIQVAFGPVIQSPTNSPITVQALSVLFGGDLTSFMKALGYKPGDLADILTTGSATVRVIAVDPKNLLLTLEASFPTIIDYDGSSLIQVQSISYSTNGSEWVTQTPAWIHTRETQVSGFDPSLCKMTDTSAICPADTTYALSPSVLSCLSGALVQCPKVRVLNGLSPRFVIYKGVVVANCRATSCVCADTGRPIAPVGGTLLTEINTDVCNIISVDGKLIRAQKRLEGVFWSVQVESLGPTIQLSPVDISSELGSINASLDAAQDSIDKSNDILSRVNPDIVNTTSSIVAIVLGAVAVFVLLILIIILAYHQKMINNLRHMVTVGSFQNGMVFKNQNQD